MVTRRAFIGAAALASFRRSPVGAEAQRAEGPLPAPLVALTSMREQARPITNDERRGRLDKARRLMAQQKIDALLLTGGTSISYQLATW